MRTPILVVCAALLGTPVFGQGLRAGYAKQDITPTEPVYMVGYALRGAPSEGVHDGEHLYVRALAFADGATSVLFVEADTIEIQKHDAFREEIAKATGVPKANILLGDAHNHAAPAPDAAGQTNWDKHFKQALLAACKQAVAGLKPVRIAAGQGHSRVAMNRRMVRTIDESSTKTFDENAASQTFGKAKTSDPVKIRDFAGVMRLGANPNGPIDDAVQIVRIDDAAGKPVAAMVHYACHGTSLGGRNSKVAGEWMGRMQAYAEREIPGLGAIYLQGAAGDINPRVVGGLDGYEDNIQVTHALGDEIGAEVVRVYRQLEPQNLGTVKIEIASRDIVLPRAYRELFDDFHNTTVIAPTTAVRIGPLMWVTLPGEFFSGIGKRVKAACPATYAHVMGYANEYIGYFPEQQAYAEGGYEPATSHLDPAAEGIYLRELAAFLHENFR